MAAGNKPGATPQAIANASENKKELQDYQSQIEAARTKLNDEDKRLKTVLQSAKANRGQAYQLVDAAIQGSYLAFQQYDLAAEALRDQPGVSPQLPEAAAQARTAIHQARSAVDLARVVEARGAGLNEDATKFKEVHKPRGDMWGEIIDRANFNPAFAFMLLGLLVGLIYFVDAELTSRWLSWLNWPIKLVFGWLHFSLHISALLFVDKTTKTLIYVSDAIAALFFAISSIVWAIIASAGWAALGQVTGGGMRVTNPELQRRLAEEATEKFATNVVNKLQWMKVCADKFEFKADGIRLAGRCFKDHYQGLFDISVSVGALAPKAGEARDCFTYWPTKKWP